MNLLILIIFSSVIALGIMGVIIYVVVLLIKLLKRRLEYYDMKISNMDSDKEE